VGIVGCGVIAQHHLSAAKDWPSVDVVAVADVRDEVARQTAEKFGIATVYHDGNDLVYDKTVEAVVLALPTGLRTPLALKALAAGKHVLLEKPVALNLGEVDAMIAAKGDRLVGCCSSRHRFLPSAIAATEVVASGKLGKIRSLFCRAIGAAGNAPQSTPPAWRVSRKLNGGGILVNWGCYDMDYLLGVTGWKIKPQVVLAQTWSVPEVFSDRVAPGSDAETHYTALVRCAYGIALTMERGEFTTSKMAPVWHIIGDKASLRLNMLPGGGVKVELDEGVSESGITTSVVWEGEESWTCIHEGPIRDFCDAIVNGTKPNTDIENAKVLQQITDAIYKSGDTGEAVKI